jgi:hypothetical protein
LEPAIQNGGWSAEDVVAIAMPRRPVLAIFATGHLLASQKGVLKKRTEIERISYGDVHAIRAVERGVRGRDGSCIEGLNARGGELFALGWSIGGGDPSCAEALAKRAAAERDRIFRVMQALI